MSLHDLEFLTCKRSRLEQDVIRYSYLSNVVQRSRATNELDGGGLEPNGLCQHRRDLSDTLGVIAGIVVAKFDGGRESLQNLELRLLQLLCALYYLPLQLGILATKGLIQEVCLEEVSDPEQHFARVERLTQEILCAEGEGAALDVSGVVTGDHDH